MNYHCVKGKLSTLVKPGDEPLNVVLKGAVRRTIFHNTLFGFPGHPIAIREEDDTGRTIQLQNTTFGPALPLLHRKFAATRSKRVKESGRKLQLPGGTFDIVLISSEVDLKPGSIQLPEHGLRYLLVSDVYDPGRYDIDTVLRYLSGIAYFRTFRNGLVKLIEITHCLSREEEERLLHGLINREPSIYSTITDLLFSIYLFPLLTRQERFEFLSGIDDYRLARSMREMDGFIRKSVEESLSKRRRTWIDTLLHELKVESPAINKDAINDLNREFKGFLEDHFSRVLLPQGNTCLTVDRETFKEDLEEIQGALLCLSGAGFEKCLIPVGRIFNHIVFMLTVDAGLVLAFNRTSCLEFENMPANSYLFVPCESTEDPIYLSLYTHGKLVEGAFKRFPD